MPRLMGSVCPPEEEDNGEHYAAYNLMLFSRARCPGPEHCADPLIFRSLLIPSDKPNNKDAVQEKPLFAPCWKMCRCELHLHAEKAAAKEKRAEKVAVIADTTIMKDYKDGSGSLHSAAKLALRIRPHLLQILAVHFDKHLERMPHGIVDLADRISMFLCGRSLYKLDEQLHLHEFAALETRQATRNIDLDILVRKKPFREDHERGVINDVDSEGEDTKDSKSIRSEFLGGGGEDDCEEQEDIEGDPTVRRQALCKHDSG